ncbi:MAG: hypothetical protein GTO12_12045 [Proteobacteria bacterium]|nr:hypothetical protein [Pseudomonadota bacterium]
MLDAIFGWSGSKTNSLRKAEEIAKKALTLDDSLAHAHALISAVYSGQHQWDKAIAEAERAVDLNPNAADNIVLLALTLVAVNRLEEAINLFHKAIRLNPIPPEWVGVDPVSWTL